MPPSHKNGMRASIEALPQQLKQGWELGTSVSLPASYKKTASVVVSGMGGSLLGAHVMVTSCADRLNAPVTLHGGYGLPSFADKHTLVILSSYSGNTEETLSSAHEAATRGVKCIAITTGGALAELAARKKWPLVLLDAKHNPSNQPRMGVGSSAMAIHAIMATLGLLKMTERDLRNAIRGASRDETESARTLASHASDRILFLLAADHLIGAAHVVNNQINENAKHLSAWFALPEFDHHFLEALSFPTAAKRKTAALLFQSKRYHPRNRARVDLTAETLGSHGIEPTIITLSGASSIEETWNLIRLGATFSLELAQKHKIDPEPVPIVEAFKQTLT